MPAPVQRFAPTSSRVAIALIGAFATAVVPVALPLALGITVSDSQLTPLLVGVLLYSAVFMVGIFWSGQWATRIVPPSDILSVDDAEMRRRVLALNALSLPYEVIEDRPGHFLVQWKPEIIRTQQTATGGVKTSSRMVVRLVAHRRQARAVDIVTKVSWSDDTQNYRWHGGVSGFRGFGLASCRLSGEYGVAFHRGAWTVTPGHRWSYSLDELKQPLMQVVLLSGWTWQPVVFR